MEQGLKKDTYLRLRHQDTHPDNIEMSAVITEIGPTAGLYQLPPELQMHVVVKNDVKYYYVKCDTCHTRHVPTHQRQYVVMPFDEESDLCYQCHK